METIDLSENTKLEKLDLSQGYINNLDLKNNINLKELNLETNSFDFKTLDLRSNKKLKKIKVDERVEVLYK